MSIWKNPDKPELFNTGPFDEYNDNHLGNTEVQQNSEVPQQPVGAQHLAPKNTSPQNQQPQSSQETQSSQSLNSSESSKSSSTTGADSSLIQQAYDEYKQQQQQAYTDWKTMVNHLLAQPTYKADPRAAELKRKEAALKTLVSAFGGIADAINVSKGGTVPVRDFRQDVQAPLHEAEQLDRREQELERADRQRLDAIKERLLAHRPKQDNDIFRLLYTDHINQLKLQDAHDKRDWQTKEDDKNRKLKLEIARGNWANRTQNAHIRIYGSGTKNDPYKYESEYNGIKYIMTEPQVNALIEHVGKQIKEGIINIPEIQTGPGWRRTSNHDRSSIEYKIANGKLDPKKDYKSFIARYGFLYFEHDGTGKFVEKQSDPTDTGSDDDFSEFERIQN